MNTAASDDTFGDSCPHFMYFYVDFCIFIFLLSCAAASTVTLYQILAASFVFYIIIVMFAKYSLPSADSVFDLTVVIDFVNTVASDDTFNNTFLTLFVFL